MSILDRMKSAATGAAKGVASLGANTLGQGKILKLLNDSPFAEYGEAQDVHLDLQGREIQLTVLLLGEAEPVRVTIKDYCFQEEGSDLRIQIGELKIDRLWAQHLVDNFAPKLDFTFTIPEEHSFSVGVALGLLG